MNSALALLIFYEFIIMEFNNLRQLFVHTPEVRVQYKQRDL